jgi:hypothetical protein
MAKSSAVNLYEGEKVINMRNYPYTIHPYGMGYLTTAGSQYSTLSAVSTAATTKSTGYKVHLATTISWPGFSTVSSMVIDEAEFGLTFQLYTTSTAKSTYGWRWEWKDKGQSTWQALSTYRTLASTAVGAERTVSGYAKLGTGYGKVPFNLRFRTYNKGAKKYFVRIKNSSYVIVKGKRST